MWEGTNSQEVGLEAAILKRKRNSSLVESARAEDSTGLKPCTEAADSRASVSGRGAFCTPAKVCCLVCWWFLLCVCCLVLCFCGCFFCLLFVFGFLCFVFW